MIKFACMFMCLFSHAYTWGRGDLEKYGPFQIALHSNLIKCKYLAKYEIERKIVCDFFKFHIRITKLFQCGWLRKLIKNRSFSAKCALLVM